MTFLVSVVIPVFNGERYLSEAISSILGQPHRPLEIVVVDDGSTDNSAAVARSHRFVTCCRQENAGLSAARNRGVDMAQGEVLGFLDADDLWAPEKLAGQLDCLARHRDLDMVFGHVEQFYSPELEVARTASIPAPLRLMPGYCAGAMLIRRESFARAGPFDPGLRVGQFLDWYIRARERGLRSLMVPETVLKRRWHLANMGIVERESRIQYARILKDALDRRRRCGENG